MKLSDIKLVIWDLDETFWKGTISEEKVSFVSEHNQFIKDLTDIGIVNSICSKNEFECARQALSEAGLWDYFVFCSIDWTSKGHRVKKIIDTMKLRADNVLFIDDNVQNLEEAKHFCPNIMTALPHEIGELIVQAKEAEKKDKTHKRLQQYKLIEEKEVAKDEFSSNEDFLKSCNIRVEISEDCEKELDRIHELILRSNQLNYTKLRQEKEELSALLAASDVNSGYVSVRDKFGDYGIVGFFAVKNNRLVHFVFSCRTLGMKIEQYVYMLLDCPELEVVGDVVSVLNDTENPVWINQEKTDSRSDNVITSAGTARILFKGPCDMSQMHAFLNLQDSAATEFSYTNDAGILVEGHNHTSQIVTALFANEERKKDILNDAEFFDKDMLETALTSEKFDYVVLSMLTDGNLGIYERRSTGEQIALCQKYYDMTDEKNKEKYISGEIFTSRIKFTSEMLDKFAEDYQYIRNENAEVTIKNLQKIWEYIGVQTKLVLLLGSERETDKDSRESYRNRHLEHAVMNERIGKWAEDKNNVILIPFDKYIRSESDISDNINHFVKRVYYDLACELAMLFSETKKVEVKGKTALLKATVKQKLRLVKAKLLSLFK